MTVRNRTYDTLWLALTVVALACFWAPVLIYGDLLYFRDLAYIAGPLKHYAAERIAAGEFPFWTSHLGAGMPFFADPATQVLYPVNAVFLVAPDAATGNTWFTLTHAFCACVAMWCLLRTLTLPRPLASAGSLLYVLSGYVLSISDNMTYLPATVWCPLALACLYRSLAAHPAMFHMLAGFCIAMPVLAGDPLNPPVLGLAALLLGLSRPGRKLRAVVSTTVVPLIWALGFSAAQWLPALEATLYSSRASGLDYGELTVWSFPVARMIEWLHPYFFGSEYPVFDFRLPALYPSAGSAWAGSVYCGAGVAALAIYAALRTGRTSAPWAGLGLICLLLSFGRHAPYYAFLLEHLPLLALQRYPEKFIFWTTLCAIVLATLGAKRLVHDHSPTPSPIVIGITIAGLLLWLGGTLYLPLIWLHGDDAWRNSIIWSVRLGTPASHAQGLVGHALIVGLAFASAVILALRHRRHAVAVVFIASVADLVWVHWYHVPRGPRTILATAPEPRLLNLLGRHDSRPIRIYQDEFVAPAGLRFDRGRIAQTLTRALANRDIHAAGYAHLYRFLYLRERLSMALGINWGFQYLNGSVMPLRPDAHRRWVAEDLPAAPLERLQDARVSFVLTPLAPTNPMWFEAGLDTVWEAPELNLRVLAVPEVPDTFSAHRLEAGKGRLPEATPAHWLANDPPLPVLSLSASEASPGAIEELPGTPERRSVRVQTTHGVTLLFRESYFPGWEVSINGQAATLRLGNRRFMAVEVPPGVTVVTFTYHPAGAYWGFGMTALTLLIALITTGLRARPRFRTSTTPA
ncbi:MAG: YfhO family protein [Pseudomonadota bacterium]